MFIRLLSDLHQEFQDYKVIPLPEDKDTILILAGDINIGVDACPFIIEQSKNFAHVVYILGNHEFYNNELDELANDIVYGLFDLPNVSFLENDSMICGGIRFIGSTLWSDMDNENPTSMFYCEQSMNDYHLIKRHKKRIIATTTINLFKQNMLFLEVALSQHYSGPTVVVTHHMPSYKSIHPLFFNSRINGAFASNCEQLMHEHDIDYWLHGHTHQTVPEYGVNGCKVRMNPFGYGGVETNINFDPAFRIEL